MDKKPNVLFICTGNSARSQMAEGFLRAMAGDRFNALSAGTEPQQINPFAIKAMQEKGIDISGHNSNKTTDYLAKVPVADAIFVCSDAEQKCPRIFPFANKSHKWFFEDPAAATGTDEEKLARFRDIRDQIEERIQAWLDSGT